jgi:putative SOS response-associated peptidase YedK
MTLAWALPGTAISAPMCGRYASFLPAEAIARIFGTTNPLPNLAPSWNVAPTNDVAVVRRHPETGARYLDLLKWENNGPELLETIAA